MSMCCIIPGNNFNMYINQLLNFISEKGTVLVFTYVHKIILLHKGIISFFFLIILLYFLLLKIIFCANFIYFILFLRSGLIYYFFIQQHTMYNVQIELASAAIFLPGFYCCQLLQFIQPFRHKIFAVLVHIVN